jgi:hypothetical protein
VWLGVAAAAAWLGCSPKEKVYHVSGRVTLGDRPVPKGLIYFDPDPSAGNTGLQGFANIEQGQYSTAQGGQGIRGGAYVVRVLGYDGKPANELPFGQPLFPEYTFPKELPAADTTLDVAVPQRR